MEPRTDDYRHAGEVLRDYRESCNVSLVQLSERLGIGRSTLSTWELGQNELALHRLIPIARALDLPPPDRDRFIVECANAATNGLVGRTYRGVSVPRV